MSRTLYIDHDRFISLGLLVVAAMSLMLGTAGPGRAAPGDEGGLKTQGDFARNESLAGWSIEKPFMRDFFKPSFEVSHRNVGGAPWAHPPGILWIDVPEAALDPDATVLKLELDGPLDLYTGAGDAIPFNH